MCPGGTRQEVVTVSAFTGRYVSVGGFWRAWMLPLPPAPYLAHLAHTVARLRHRRSRDASRSTSVFRNDKHMVVLVLSLVYGSNQLA